MNVYFSLHFLGTTETVKSLEYSLENRPKTGHSYSVNLQYFKK